MIMSILIYSFTFQVLFALHTSSGDDFGAQYTWIRDDETRANMLKSNFPATYNLTNN